MKDFAIIFFAVVIANILTVSTFLREHPEAGSTITEVTNTVYIVEVHEETLMDMMESTNQQ